MNCRDFIFQVINNDWNITEFGVKIKAEVGVTATNWHLSQTITIKC